MRLENRTNGHSKFYELSIQLELHLGAQVLPVYRSRHPHSRPKHG